MKLNLTTIFLFLLLVSGCSSASATPSGARVEPTRAVAIIPRAPTATNFPLIGTPTAIPAAPTPKPTPTPRPDNTAMFDDPTLEQLMTGTINSAGVQSTVKITDTRATGGERIAYITIISEHNLDDNDLLLKLFVLEVGNALRTIRGFSEGSMNADLDAAFLTVTGKQGELFGTVSAPMSEIVRFLDGQSSVDEALNHLTLTGVFETFKKK